MSVTDGDDMSTTVSCHDDVQRDGQLDGRSVATDDEVATGLRRARRRQRTYGQTVTTVDDDKTVDNDG